MAKETILKLYKHFLFLANGDFSEEAFRKEFGSEGFTSMGRMSPERRALIVSDAKRNIKELEAKFPYLLESKKEVSVVETQPIVETKTKSKGAK